MQAHYSRLLQKEAFDNVNIAYGMLLLTMTSPWMFGRQPAQ